jgi:hypothetical protein
VDHFYPFENKMVGQLSNFMKSFAKAIDYIKDSFLFEAGKLLAVPIFA